FIQSAKGSKIYSEDGSEFIDYVGSWGPMIAGHSHPRIVGKLREVIENGTSFGAPTDIEIKLASLVCGMIPSIEKIRMVNSGTEATMSAVRLARGFTGKDKIIKFTGCYHGHGDSFLIKAGSGALTLGIPDSPGVTKGTASDTILAEFNNIDSVRNAMKGIEDRIAAVIVEPIPGNMGVVPPEPGFLEFLRKITAKNQIVLIFDEVMTGFRVAKGGAQELYNITPDLTTLGKIIGGGLPVGAYGGKAEIMNCLAPDGPVYQAGTLSGNPLAMNAGYETLSIVNENGFYETLEEKSRILEDGIRKNAETLGMSIQYNRIGSMAALFFSDNPVKDFSTAVKSDTDIFKKYYHLML
ncbi:glutamate-1-semialdehyde 2,1-aminomutase, partial [bacterium]|nr:glutamate-1-semialdehyde 2,1-aminomutase [bacterium]